MKQVETGQFDPHLELHLSQYAADPRWALDFAAARAVGSAIFGEYGSTTARHLFSNTQVALNLQASDRLQVRYERRNTADERFDLNEERLAFSWFPRNSWALVVTGWPTHLKEQASLGLGFRFGAPGSPNNIEVLLIADQALWNQKTEDPTRFTRTPLRLLVDGSWNRGPWRVAGSLGLGRAWKAETPTPTDTWSSGGQLRHGRMLGEFQGRKWAIGGRLLLAAQRTEQTSSQHFLLDRCYGRIEATGRRGIGAMTLYCLVGYANQRDRFDLPSSRNGSYRLASQLLGIEGGWRWRRSSEIRLGFLGHRYDMRRISRPPDQGDPGLADRTQDGWADKVHGRLLWDFRPGMSMEVLLSQTVNGSRFGGGSVKARFVF